jgi:tetratricopeptide (TPR) repeat protein
MLNKTNIDSRKHIFIIYIVLTIVTLAVFWQVRHCDFINFDDPVYVTTNKYIRSGITWDRLSWAFGTKYFGLWNPLVWISFMFDHQFYGLNAGGYHLTNLILHIMSTLLLLWFFHRMTGMLWRSAFVAAFFALHPMHVESVAWIAERKDVLSAFFWMLTLCLYIYYTEKPVIRRYLPVLFSFVLALLSKPMVVTLPVVMLLLDYWPLNRLQSRKTAITAPQAVSVAVTGKGKKKNGVKKKSPKENVSGQAESDVSESEFKGIIPLWQLKEKTPFFILSAFLAIITIYNPENSSYQQNLYSLGDRLANAPVAFVTYLEKTFFPYDMAFNYPFSTSLPVWQIMGAILLIIIISAAVIIMAKRMPYLFVGWAWFGITIAPVIGIIQISTTTPYSMADRYHYLPSIGIAVMLAWGVPVLFKSEKAGRQILFPAVICVLAVWAAIAWKQCGYWKNSFTLFSHTLQVTKNNDVAHNNLASALIKEGKAGDAIDHCNQAIQIKPDHASAFYNRGLAYYNLGRYQDAIKDYSEAIRLQPDLAKAYNNRGFALSLLGQYQNALEDLNKAIIMQPDYSLAHKNRGTVYLMMGNIEAGCRDADAACEMGDCGLMGEAKDRGLCR